MEIIAGERKRNHPPRRDVRLLPGTPFYDRQQEMLEFLAKQDTDSMLYNFRTAAGLPTGGAEPMTGWEADDCKLRGHTTGHFLSALSLAYAETGEELYLKKAEAVVDGLAECQDAMTVSGEFHLGFLSAYDEEQFDLLEELVPYPEIWAPYYTLDKIMAGLLDAYELAGIDRARDVLSLLGKYIYERLSRVTEKRREEMWETYIAGEYGAMIGTLVRVWRMSGNEEHIGAARLFDNPKLFGQMREGRDELDGMHANQHIPQLIGALEIYYVTGNESYLDIARNFEEIVTKHHCFSFGGTGDEERFFAADSECSHLSPSAAESCASVNMLRLTSKLFEKEETARADLMDYYERTLFNHILMSMSHTSDGGTTYFLPLAPGSCKHYETEENSCCHGTGMESRFRYVADIYSFEGEGDDAVMRVDLPVSSALDGEEKLTVRFSDDGRLEVKAAADIKRKLAVRIPEWARESFPEAEDGYVYCGRLKAGESVVFELPMELRRIDASDSSYYCLAWGPYILAALSDSEEFLQPDITRMHRSSECGVFTDGGVRFVPLYMVDGEKYHIYFRCPAVS